MKVFSKEKFLNDPVLCEATKRDAEDWINEIDGVEVTENNTCRGYGVTDDWCVEINARPIESVPTENKRPSQADRIYQYMQDRGSITPAEALREFNCMRLASRICDLRRRGVKIVSEIVYTYNTYGDPIKYAKYHIDNAG